MNSDDRFETIACPHCRQSIYVWFVKTNGRCPACQKEVKIPDVSGDDIRTPQTTK
jgi:uncharacterized protein (DUF983 family)